MRPSAVRSKSAPHASSSRTRSGASRACSSAMRQLFTYCPPRIVSAKCTFQLSRSSTLASAAATPPSAITVCALPSSDLQISPTLQPAFEASIAARNPAPPAPMTRTSYSRVWISVAMLEEPHVVTRAGDEADVDVGEADAEERDPGPQLVVRVQDRDAAPQLEARVADAAAAREAVLLAAHQVAQRMAAEGVEPEEDRVERQHDRAEAHAEVPRAVGRGPDVRLHRVVAEDEDEQHGDVGEEAVQVLQHERQRLLAPVGFARFADGARDGILPDRA